MIAWTCVGVLLAAMMFLWFPAWLSLLLGVSGTLLSLWILLLEWRAARRARARETVDLDD